MEPTYIAIMFGVILWIIYKLIDRTKKRDKEEALKANKFKKTKDVDWFGPDVSIKRKSYPRQRVNKPPDEPTGHSTSAGMNDSTDAQKREFNEQVQENKDRYTDEQGKSY